MAIVRVQVTFDHDSGLVEDQVVNVWHADVPTVGDWTNFQADLESFYTDVPVGETVSPAGRMSSAMAGTGTMRAYNLSDTPPRVPFGELGFTFTPGGDRQPSEVAIAVSFQAPVVSGVPQARRRGRIFFGPLARSAADDTTGRPQASTISTLAKALRNLIIASNGDATYAFGVYSPTLNSIATVTNGWVDNAFDTQRRRGEDATARTLVSATAP